MLFTIRTERTPPNEFILHLIGLWRDSHKVGMESWTWIISPLRSRVLQVCAGSCVPLGPQMADTPR